MVAFAQFTPVELLPVKYLQIDLDRDTVRSNIQLACEPGDSHSLGNVSILAVHLDFHTHGHLLTSYGTIPALVNKPRRAAQPQGFSGWSGMTTTNQSLSTIFHSVADFLAAQGGANPHRIRAYRRAAETLAQLSEPVEEIARRGALQDIAGIGRELSAKIQEFLTTGRVESYESLKTPLPEEVADWVTLPGLSPAIVQHLYFRLGIRTLSDLEALARSHMLQTIPGMTASDDQILTAIRERPGAPKTR